jgi:DNA replicative helicase MCM subunit Mcm2 (Cdc46/Mcm family)
MVREEIKIPKSISDFIATATSNYQNLGANIEQLYAAKISQAKLEFGSGICLKMEEVPLNSKSPNPDQSAIRFIISDGTYAVECMAHNGNLDARPGGMDSDRLRNTMMMLTESISDGSQLCVSGAYQMMGRDKVFVASDVQRYESLKTSQMTDEQFETFTALCQSESTDMFKRNLRPLELMLRDDTIWTKLYADDPIKTAVMLYCLSPQKKTDMLHIGIVSSMGEGKDHLIEQVIEPLVPCGMASSGKLCTIAGLFGAMSGDDLNSIELGLIPKMNNERIAVSEFQTWSQEVFGELMNVMANGKFSMQKGQVDTTRDGKVNFMFLGNPPREWKPETSGSKLGMLGAFGEYTYQILSRLTLIFARMTLTDGNNDFKIEEKIMDSMNGKYLKSEFNTNLEMWRSFFREYLRYVSEMDPDITPVRKEIRETMDRIKANPDFSQVFLEDAQGNKRTSRDFRKFQEFVNLTKGFARLNGERQVSKDSVRQAEQIFLESIRTLVADEGWKLMKAGVSQRLVDIHSQLEIYDDNGVYRSVSEMRKNVKFSNEDIEKIVNLGWIHPQPEGISIHKSKDIWIMPRNDEDED